MLGTLLQKSSQTLFDLLFPQSCVHCQTSDSWLCQTCYNSIPFITTTVCNYCGTPVSSSFCRQCDNHSLQYIDGIRSAAYFEDNPLRTAIHALKYRNHKAIAQELADILANTYRYYQLQADVIIPIPLHNSRVKERGYNQSELLAHKLSDALKIPVNTKITRRIRKTRTQMTLGVEERRQNVHGAFACQGKQLTHQRVLLIDDVCTTGSTLDSCAAALKSAGAVSVWGLTLAKAR